MNKVAIFFLGFIAGAVATAIVLLGFVLFNFSSREIANHTNVNEEIIEGTVNSQPSNIQYVDVRGKNGEVTLHTFMPKDSVKILVGKPTRTRMMTIDSDSYETWSYEFPGQGSFGSSRHLSIKFINGELKSIMEN